MSSKEEHHALDAEISLATIESNELASKANDSALSESKHDKDESVVDHMKQPQGSPNEGGKNYNEFFDGKKNETEVQAFDDEMKSIDLNHDEHALKDKQQELGYFPMDMSQSCGFDTSGNPLPQGHSEDGSLLKDKMNDKKKEVIKAIEGYQNKIRAKIEKPPTWAEMFDNLCEFF